MGRARPAPIIAVDTSALVAIAFAEPERLAFIQTIEQAGTALLSTVSAVEARMVVQGRRGQRALMLLDDILRQPVFQISAPGIPEMDAAFAAFITFGKGSGHRAALNFGDLFSYALAKVRGIPLLYKGDDFIHTDIQSALST